MAPNANLEINRATASREDLLAELDDAYAALRELVITVNKQAAQADRHRALVYGMHAVVNDFTARSMDTSLLDGEGHAMDAQLARMATWAHARDLLYAKLRELR